MYGSPPSCLCAALFFIHQSSLALQQDVLHCELVCMFHTFAVTAYILPSLCADDQKWHRSEKKEHRAHSVEVKEHTTAVLPSIDISGFVVQRSEVASRFRTSDSLLELFLIFVCALLAFRELMEYIIALI